MKKEKIFLEACNNKKTSRPPIWFMRQAGRYLPEYRELRTKYSFVEMIHNPDIVTQVTLQPLKRFNFDAAILYSDILTVSDYFGIQFEFIEKKGPVLKQSHLSVAECVERFESDLDITKLQAVYTAITYLKQELKSTNIPLIGFAGSPFTVACYIVEQTSSKTFSKVFNVINSDPELFKRLLSALTKATIVHLKKQIDSGVEAIQIFDTWGSLLTGSMYQEYTLNSLKEIINALKDVNIPIILYSKNSEHLMNDLCGLPINVLGVDWNSSLPSIKQKYPHIALQGNLNPNILLTDKHQALADTKAICKQMQDQPGFVFNLGHGILPQTPIDHVHCIVDYVKEFSFNN